MENKSILEYRRKTDMPHRVRDVIYGTMSKALSEYKSFYDGIKMAALFDLFVSCEYYGNIASKGWTYCSLQPPMLLYSYTNACPRCLSNLQFKYTKGNKPGSGQIGVATTDILCEMLSALMRLNESNVEVSKASEPADAILYEPDTETIVLAEIKASPLLTVPIAADCDPLTEDVDGVLTLLKHTVADNPFVRKSDLFLYFPATRDLPEQRFYLPIEWSDESPFFEAVYGLVLRDEKFLEHFFHFWREAFQAYSAKDRENPAFWLTNACGSPVPRPSDWPKRSGSGYETVSDAKTSVGLDRTDDIKKGIYQVLKLGADFKPNGGNIKVALISNVHAVRHYDEYLQCIKDVIWTLDETGTAADWEDLPDGKPLYNLFDGIVSFTKSEIRDPEVARIMGML